MKQKVMGLTRLKQVVAFCLVLSLILQGATPISAAADNDRAGTIHYLSDMVIQSSTNEYGEWTKDKDFDTDRPIELKMSETGTMVFEKGLTANSVATATYDISNYGGQTFFAYVGVHCSQLGNGTCDFEVQIDGDSKWKSSKIFKPDDIAEQVLIDIPQGAREMKLLIGNGNDNNYNDHGVWAQACILENKNILKTLDNVEVEAPAFLEVGEEDKIAVRAICFDKTEVAFDSDIHVSCQILDENVAELRQDGQDWVIIGKKGGSTKLQVTVTDTVNKTEKTQETDIAVVQETQSICSPNGEKKMSFVLLPSGKVCYNVFTDADSTEKLVATGDSMGLVTNLGNFSDGLFLVDMTTRDVKDSYDLIGAKKTHVDAVGKEMVLKYKKDSTDGVYFYIIARVYDDGVAFRYQISSDVRQDLMIQREQTSIVLPDEAVSQAMRFATGNESYAEQKVNGQLNGAYSMPLLYEVDGTFCLISEAALSQEYAGAALYGDGTGRLEVRVSEGDSHPTPTITTSTSVLEPWDEEEHPWLSPWRFIVIGDLKTINGNTMAETLSPECVLEDTSWIKPGACGWTWLNGEGCSSLETYKEYVDMAADMGWEYILLDEGWQPGSSKAGYRYYGYYDWFDELMEYANEKGIGLLVWAHHEDLNTPEKQKVLKEWAEKGIKGIKPDFFDSHSQYMMKIYMQLFQETAKNKLLLDVHGVPKTTGERRTYPHLLTREGIYGAEQIVQNQVFLTARHNCLLPFMRNAVGPADYTPMLSTATYNSPLGGGRTYTHKGRYTTGQMAAMPIIIETGLNCMADTANVYLNSPVRPLYVNIPCEWEDSKVMEADLGNYVTIMRESADDKWYIGTICDAARTTNISLDFLPAGGEYYAYIAEDDETGDNLNVRVEKVIGDDSLNLNLKDKGGALILIQKEPMTEFTELTLNEHEVEMSLGESILLKPKMAPEDAQIRNVVWSSSDESVVTVKNGRVMSVGVGMATVTAEAGTASDSCRMKVYPSDYEMRDAWSLVREEKDYYSIENENTLKIMKQAGGLYKEERDTANNMFFISADKDFEVSVKLSFSPTSDYQSAGLLALASNKTYVGVWRRYHSALGNNILNMVNYDGSNASEDNKKSDSNKENTVWLKLVKNGESLISYTSENGTDWTELGTETNVSFNQAATIQVGIYAGNDKSYPENVPAVFENFTYKAKGGEERIISFGQKPVRRVMGIELSEAGKTNYMMGDVFDASGYNFRVYYTDRTSETIAGKDCQVNGFNSALEGRQEVTFSYQGMTTTAEVYVSKNAIKVNKITVTGNKKEITKGETIMFKANVEPSNAYNKDVRWSSSNQAVATVDAQGKVTAKGAGKATITATAADGSGVKGDFEITVKENPEKSHKVKKITLKCISNKIAAGKKVNIKATVTTTGEPANKKLSWTTSNKKYATVNTRGVVTTKKKGAGKTVTITANAADGSGKKASIKIKILKHAVKKITLKCSRKTVAAGKKVTVKAKVAATGKKANKALVWRSSNEKYATVSKKGVVKAKKAGRGKTVTITARTTDGTNKKKSIKIKIK